MKNIILILVALVATSCAVSSKSAGRKVASEPSRLTNVMGVDLVRNGKLPLDPVKKDFEHVCKEAGNESYMGHAVTYSRETRRKEDAMYDVYCNTGKIAEVGAESVKQADAGTVDIIWPRIEGSGSYFSKSSNEDTICKMFGYNEGVSIQAGSSENPATLKISGSGKIKIKQPGFFMYVGAIGKAIVDLDEPELKDAIRVLKCK